VKTGFGFAKLAGFTGFPVLAKTGFHSLIAVSRLTGPKNIKFLSEIEDHRHY